MTSAAKGILAYGAYLPRHRLSPADLGAGRGERVVAGFDEDSTTMGVAAARPLVRDTVASLYFATTSPAYADKTNASALHAALGLPRDAFAVDLAGAARSGIGVLRAAAATGGLAVLADIRTGRHDSPDERSGGDGAVAFLFGDADPLADVIGHASVTAELLDRWRLPAEVASRHWEERFGLEAYLPLVTEAGSRVLAQAGVDAPDHLVVASPNRLLLKKAAGLFGAAETTYSPIGHAGAADVGLALAAALDKASAGQTVLVVSAEGGADAILLKVTDRIATSRPATAVIDQLDGGRPVAYPTYLAWRGLLEREPARRPDPDAPAAPPSQRSQGWKFGFNGSRCGACGFVHLPPMRVCRRCGSGEAMVSHAVANAQGTVATFTVDRLAFSLSPPVINAVVDFAGGGRCLLELSDTTPDDVAVGAPVELTFRRLYTAAGVHNYFWKAILR